MAKKGTFDLGVQDDNVLVRNQGPGREWGLDKAARLGAKTIRVNLTYGDPLQPVDDLIASAAKRGMKVQLTLTGVPAYAYHAKGERPGQLGPVNAPIPKISADRANPKEFGRWAKKMAEHFKGRVGRYSIWNEPNHPYFLKNREHHYVKLYQAAHRAIRGVDRKAQILAGELAPSGDARSYVKALGKAHVRLNGIAIHPYQPLGASPDQPYPQGKQSYTISNINALKKTMRRFYGKELPIYLTEFGYGPSEGPQRAGALKAAIGQARKAGARQLVLYQLVGTPEKTWNTGLYGPGGEETEASQGLYDQPAYRRKAEPHPPMLTY